MTVIKQLFKIRVDEIDATYKGEINDLQCGNRGNDFEIMSGLHDNSKSILRDAMDEAEHSH